MELPHLFRSMSGLLMQVTNLETRQEKKRDFVI